MNEPLLNSESKAQIYLDKAATYKKLGLKAQVQYELEQAKRIDPYVVQEARYKELLQEDDSEKKAREELKIPLRIGAGMLIIDALLTIFILFLLFTTGTGSDLGFEYIVSLIVDIVIAVNLWQLKEPWKRYTVWWALIGFIFFGLSAISTGDYFSLILQAAFSGSMILLLAGTPSKGRTIAAVAVYAIFYVGLICLSFTLSFLGGFLSAV